VLVDAVGAEGPSAVPEGELAPFEVAQELLPLLRRDHPVFLQRPAISGRTSRRARGRTCESNLPSVITMIGPVLAVM
jgi:hypothetical protein